MFESLMTGTWWLGAMVFVALALSDAVLTKIGYDMYLNGVDRHIQYEFYELNSLYRADVDAGRLISGTFLGHVIGVSLVLWFFLFVYPSAYLFVLGMFLGIQIAIHVRHLQNIGQYYYIGRSLGVKGHIAYDTWVTFRFSALNFAGMALVFGVGFLMTESWCIAGAGVNCLLQALNHLWSSVDKTRAVPDDVPVVAEPVEEQTDGKE